MNPDAPGAAASTPGWFERKVLKARDIVYYAGLRVCAALLGFKPRHRALDRRILDEEILPRLARNDRFARVLFVGCDWYTEHVEDLFRSKGRTYTTIEIDPARARHGASRHITGALEELGRYTEPGTLDLIICNGVIGWGLNQPADIERALEACAVALSAGGVLLLGWDEVPEKLPLPIEAIRALRALSPVTPNDFETPRIATGSYTRHTFGFWEKRLP